MVVLKLQRSVPFTLLPPHFVDVKRDFGLHVCGYLLKNSNLVVLRRFEGFSPAGISVVRKCDVNDLFIDEKWTQMIRDEGHAHFAEERFELPTTSLRDLADALRERGRNILIDCEGEGSAEYGVHVGRVVASTLDHLAFSSFDNEGRWDLCQYSIPYASITRIEIDDPYVDTFSKYIAECPVTSQDA